MSKYFLSWNERTRIVIPDSRWRKFVRLFIPLRDKIALSDWTHRDIILESKNDIELTKTTFFRDGQKEISNSVHFDKDKFYEAIKADQNN